MRLLFDEDLVEAVVLLCANEHRDGVPSLQIRRFHREREKLYSVLDADERNDAFFKLHLDWFREWGLEKVLLDLLQEFPLLTRELKSLAFRKARGKNEEGAELFVSTENGRTGVVALRAEKFENDLKLLPFLRHEWMHLNDMLNPAFGYSPRVDSPGQNPAQQRLVRERYRLLWDITIDGRILTTRRSTISTCEKHEALFQRAYSFWPEEKRRKIFNELWNDARPTHEMLLRLSNDPRELNTVQQPLPGASCPLCNFPTFHWAEIAALSADVLDAIRHEFPAWVPEQGVCGRCAEVYQTAATAAKTAEAH